MGIYWKNIDPQLQVLGPQQQFNFSQNFNQLQFNTSFVPTLTIPSENSFEFANSSLSGFRFRHVTESGDTFGTLKIQSFVSGQTTGIDLMTFNSDGTITLDANLILDDLNFTKLGIGVAPSTDGRIEFANISLDTKIRFFTNNTPGNPFDQSGMGYLSTAGTLYHCPIGQSHLFFAGANGNLPVEINALGMIVAGNGYSPTDFRKIIFFQDYQTTNPHQTYAHGILLTGGSAPNLNFDLRTQIASSAGAFSWCYGISSSASYELMRLDTTNGLVVKNQAPATVGNDSYTYFKLENSATGGYRFRHDSFSSNPAVGTLTLQIMNGSGSTLDIFNTGFSNLTSPGFGGDLYTVFGPFNINASQATLGVNEGKQNVLNEASCFRVVSSTNAAKIEIQNTGASGRLYEIRSQSDGGCGIFDRTSNALRFLINASGAITTGLWNGSVIGSQYGGTGVNNGGRTLSYAGNVSIGGTFQTTNNFLVNGSFTVNQNFSTNQPFSTNGAVTMQGAFTTNGNITLRTLSLGGSADVYLPVSGTLATLSNSLDQFSAPGANLSLNSFKITNLATPINSTDAATKGYVDSQLAGGFGPSEFLPYAQLNFNWANGVGGVPYIFNHTINDSAPFFKQHIYQVMSLPPDVQRKWQVLYNLGDPNAWNPSYQLTFYHPVFSPGGTTPLSLVNIGGGVTPTWGLFLTATLDMGGFEIKNALNPTTAQSLATKNYVDTSTLTLTGSVTGTGNVNGSLATSFSNNQSVTGGDTQTFTFTPSLASAYFNLFNANTSATSQIRIGNSGNYLACGYAASGGYTFINSQNINSLQFLLSGLPQATLTGTGLGLGTTTPTAAKLQIVGGVQNIIGEETALRVSSSLNNVKIELQSTAAGGKLYELRSSSAGSFDITDRTGAATRFAIMTTGDCGINMGGAIINGQLQLPNVIRNRQLVLWSLGNNDFQFHGFGSTNGGLRYSINATTDSHIFVAGASASSANEVGRITGTGDFISPGTIYGRRSSGMVYMEGNAVATTLTANVWTKLGGITIASGLLKNFTSPVSNRLTYVGTLPFNGATMISATLNFSAGAASTTRDIALFKNGIQVTPSLMSESSASGLNLSIYTSTFLSLTTNDYIEVWCRSSVASNVTPVNLIMISIDC